jgi:hypothetical protein
VEESFSAAMLIHFQKATEIAKFKDKLNQSKDLESTSNEILQRIYQDMSDRFPIMDSDIEEVQLNNNNNNNNTVNKHQLVASVLQPSFNPVQTTVKLQDLT